MSGIERTEPTGGSVGVHYIEHQPFRATRNFKRVIRNAALAASTLVAAGCQPASQSDTTTASPPKVPVAVADAKTQEAPLALAADIRNICLDRMPDVATIRRAVEGLGVTSRGTFGDYFLFGGPDDLIVGISAQFAEPTCIVIVRGMTPAQGRALIVPWLQAANARPDAAESSPNAPAWRGTIGGITYGFSVLDEFNLPGVIRGAAIGMRQL